MPIQVVARTPIAGINQRPAASAPTAAPAVLAAYNPPASAAPSDAGDWRRDCCGDLKAAFVNQAAAIGNVAPIAMVGSPSAAMDSTTRTIPNRAG